MRSLPNPVAINTEEKPKRRYQGRPEYQDKARPSKASEKRTPPWDRKPARTFKKSTPWGSKEAVKGKVNPATRWEKKKTFSARDAVEGKPKRWDSRPTKPQR